MSVHDDQTHLLDIARAARLIHQFAAESDAEDFEQNLLVQSAILHQFLVLGEAAKRLSAPFKSRHHEIPWRQMAGMRDRLIHGYEAVNLALVWRTATRDVPALLEAVAPLLPDPPDSDRATG